MSILLAAAAGEQSLGQALLIYLPWLVIFAIFYVIAILPMRRKQKAHEALLENLKKGDKVITNGGLYGEVVKVEGRVVLLKLAENVKVRVSKQGIAGLEGEPAEKGD